FDPEVFLGNECPAENLSQLSYHKLTDFQAGMASGSFRTAGMVICPCSMGTLGSLANGLSTNLIHRAADVHLKERRKLILVPRETPLSSIQLENMKRLADAGAVILPAMPGFYHDPQSIDDLFDFIVARICDHLGVETRLMKRWSE
ncbi:MAG: UbiX family flavin prenyltransferase, partial [Planctomycetaceae bacterium]|nr:UbiX family flavin prenyltransferase [Planctomycetaceae bacterium]